MKYIVDRFEGDKVILEVFDTLEIVEFDKSLLPNNIYEGALLIYENGEYRFDLSEEELRRKKIEEKFKQLKG